VFLVGLTVYTLVVARRWQRLQARSIAEFFGRRFSPALQKLTSALLMLAMVGFCATYVRSADWIFSPALAELCGRQVSGWLTSAALVTVVLTFTLRGGLVAVAHTDFAAFLATVVALPTLAIVSWWTVGPDQVASAFAELPPGPTVMPPAFVLSLVALTSYTYLASPWYGQRMFAAESERTAFLAVGISAGVVFALYGTAVAIALPVRAAFPELASPELAVPTALASWAPMGAKGLGYAVLFTIAITTISSIWNTWVTLALTDFGFASNLANTQRGTLVIAGVSWVAGNTLVDAILDKMILANIPIASLLFGILGGLFWPGATTAGVWASIFTGFVGAVFCFLWFGDAGMYTAWWAFGVVPLSCAVGVAVSLLSRLR
jgi:SSS family solute:Na+ symporter